MAVLDRRAETGRIEWRTTGPAKALRHSDESMALVRAVVLGTVLVVLLAGLTFGFILGLLALTVVSVFITMRIIASQSADVSRMTDPRLRNLAVLACARLEVPMPPVYVQQDPSLNAFTMGLGATNIVVLNSALVGELPPDELLFVVGHELGHMKFGHAGWLTLTSPLRVHPFFWVSALLGLSFNGWSLKTEYTADRAGLVAVGAVEPAISALSRITTGRPFDGIASTALTSGDDASLVDRIAEHCGTHPFLRNRIAGVLEFARSHPELLSGLA